MPDTIVGALLMLAGLIGLGYWAITRSVADAADWPNLAAAEDEADQRRAAARAEWVDCCVAFAWIRVDCAVEKAHWADWEREVAER